MNIKISDNWLREYIETNATVSEMAKALSLCSVGVERIEKIGSDSIYDIEITTNRPDLMSVVGIAREASAVLPQFGIDATFKPLKPSPNISQKNTTHHIEIKNDPKLVQRILAVVMDVTLKKSPDFISKRLEKSDIRSLNNIIDVTNYVMREVGHPAHVFDYDRLQTKKLIIRYAKPGEAVTTLDNKTHTLQGGDIVADNGQGEIVDLLGVMGTANSVIQKDTKRILFFLDNNNPHTIRKTSMSLGIRTEAAVLNEKGVDPELMYQTFLRGIELYQEIAEGKIVSEIIDIYPHKPKVVTIKVSTDKVRSTIGVTISDQMILRILKKLGFSVENTNSSITVTVPSYRLGDVEREEDIIEEVARVYGYHNLPSILPPTGTTKPYHLSTDQFYWERRVKSALKYWGFTEVYTYSMVSEDLLEGSVDNAVALKNPLDQDHMYMRRTLVPSLLQIVNENTHVPSLQIFELANVYKKKEKNLPEEILHLAGVIKKEHVSFYEVKGYIQSLLEDLGITAIQFKTSDTTNGASVIIKQSEIGTLEILDDNCINFELNFQHILTQVSSKKQYQHISIHPPIIEDVRIAVDAGVEYETIIQTIKKNSSLIKSVELLDTYKDKKTFRITYQHATRNLTNDDIIDIRKKITSALKKDIQAAVV
ncbi:MAG TPA: phenylalanine--tRNA ligase subunit beta [Candidatus Levybacteria bacterium]|nr:phenylalanine--tRNA ligase subunit beta [Candidatus Levybacteria bacterium]